MSVKKHSSIDGAWVIDWWPEGRKGKRKRETYVGTYEAAVSRWTELLQQHAMTSKGKTNPRLRDILPEYLEWLELHRSPGYYKSMVWALEKLRPHFGNFPITQITEQLINDFKRKYQKCPAHCNQCLDYLKVIIGWMADRHLARRLPFRIEKLPVFRSLPQPPSPDDFRRFMASVEGNFHVSGVNDKERANKKALLLIMYETGIRWVEARHLRWENVNLEDGRVYLGRTKTGIARFTILPGGVLELLRPFKEDEGLMFINPQTGAPYGSLRKLISNNAKSVGAGIKGSHGLRHAMGADVINATGDLRSAQDILGHANLRSTQIYTQIATEHKREVLEATRTWRTSKLTLVKKTRPAKDKLTKAGAAKTEGVSTADKKKRGNR